jgi:hypothetical protein
MASYTDQITEPSIPMTIGLIIFLAMVVIATVRVTNYIYHKSQNIHHSTSVADEMDEEDDDRRFMGNDDLHKPGFDLLPGGSLNPHNDNGLL